VRALALAALALCLLAAGCGSGGESSSSEPPTTAAPAGTGRTAETDVGPGADGEPAIVVESPAPNATVTSPVTVSGTADVFEATVTVVVEDADGNELARDFTTASCGTGCRGDFTIDVPFAVEEAEPGTIVVQDDDAAGTGTPPHVVRIPVTLEP
jgi:hypothetical protein